MSDRVSQHVLLCEDDEQRRLAMEYMKRCGISTHRAVTAQVASEKQQGNASQWVLNEFPRQLHACRQRATRAQTLLVVFIDADKWSVHQRREQLNEHLRKAEYKLISADDAAVLLVPKWHVETWICALLGRTVSEDDDCKDWNRPTKQEIRQAAQTAYDWARDNAEPGPTCVPSLRTALPGWRKIG